MDLMSQIYVPVQIAAASTFVVLAGIGGTYLVKFLRSRVKNEFLANVLAKTATAVATAVKATAQTYTDALKAKAADGKLTPEEQKEAFQEAMSKAMSYVSLSEIAKAFGLASVDHAEMFLADKVEAAVKDLKALPTAPEQAAGK